MRAYADINGNGQLDADSDPDLDETTPVATDVTAGSLGTYTLSLLPPGDYIICEETQVGWEQSPGLNTFCQADPEVYVAGYALSLTSGQTISGRDFANRQPSPPPPGTIIGHKFNDRNGNRLREGNEPWLTGWTMRAYADINGNGQLDADSDPDLDETTPVATDVTAGSLGTYTLSLLPPGDYIICEETQVGWEQSPGLNTFCQADPEVYVAGYALSLASGQTISGRDFANRQPSPPPPGTIIGHKFNDRNGNRLREGNEPWLTGWTMRAYADINGNGQLDADSDPDLDETTPVATDVTAGSLGTYTLSLLPPGDYIICEETQVGWEQSPGLNTFCQADPEVYVAGYALSLASGQTISGRDFANRQQTGTVEGLKFNDLDGDRTKQPAEPGLEGWTIQAYADTNGTGQLDAGEAEVGQPAGQAITAADGSYQLTLTPGDYIICEETQPDWEQTAPTPADNECGDSIAGLADGGYAITLGAGEDVSGKDFGNRLSPGSIVIKKNTLGPDGSFNFDGPAGLPSPANASGDFSIATAASTGSATFTDVTPGSYVISELGPPALWTLTALACNDGASPTPSTTAGQTATVKVDPGETVICTFTNTKVGSIVIKKNTLGPDGSFNFDGPAGLPSPANASGDFSIATAASTGSATFTDVTPGSYVISELGPPALWTLTALACNDGASPTPSTTAGQTATVKVDPGETVICTFTNTKVGSIVIKKNTLGPDGSFNFDGPAGLPSPANASGDFSIATAASTGSATFTDVTPGSYVISELGPPALWTLTALACNDGASPTPSTTAGQTATVKVDPGETVICTFTNTKVGSIVIKKNTLGPDGSFNFDGPAGLPSPANASGDFSIATAASTGSATFTDVTPGSYVISELGPPALWTLTALACNDGASPTPSTTAGQTATVKVDPGETVICTFTNTKVGSIVIKKNTLGPDGSFNFDGPAGLPSPANASGDFSIATAASTGSATFTDVTPGSYVISELGPPALWTLTALACNDGASPTPSTTAGQTATVKVDPGETVICTFTNSKSLCTIIGTNRGETLRGTSGDDVICARGGNDMVFGLGGNDVLLGEGDDDTLNGGPGNDKIYGGDLLADSGNDTVTYSDRTTSWTINLGLGSACGINLVLGSACSGPVETDLLFGIENAEGSNQVDKISGSSGPNGLSGLAGNDTIDGGFGGDNLYGGGGADELYGGGGADYLAGEGGTDGLFGGSENDTLEGGPGADLLRGEAGADLLKGEDGEDRLFGGDDGDTLLGGTGSDILDGGKGDDNIAGGLPSQTSFDWGTGEITGGDTVLYDDTAVWVGGLAGVGVNLDSVLVLNVLPRSGGGAGFGNDSLSDIENVQGSPGRDTIIGSSANNALAGGDASDTMSGRDGDDLVSGGKHDDALAGNDGNDLILGGNGADKIDGGRPNQRPGDKCYADGPSTPGSGADQITNCERP